MTEIKWRFPGNNYTADNGLDTADMETFKKDAISSLAREICQNSIDAKNKAITGPVRIDFHSFAVNKNDIPGRECIEEQIDACIKTWGTNRKIVEQLNSMHTQIQRDTITCLRISDFNTTGLTGVSGGDNTPWHYLIHGSGLSDKGVTSGGSKGIGKFATFVTSHFNTVFYSTNTNKGEHGYEGICKLCSAKQNGTTEKTQGTGYFGSSSKNEPITTDALSLDKSFVRADDEYGCDIYIIGFKAPDNWQSNIISKALDSFMAAVVFGELEITVDDVLINSSTLKDIVFDDNYIIKTMRKSIVSQYLLLTDKTNRYEDTIAVRDLGNARLYLMEFSEDNEQYATNDCVMVRYPYMKIKELKKISSLPCSALCIIEDNRLNAILRNVENPQHTDWEFNRIEDASERAEVKAIYKELYDQIKDLITKHLASSDDSKTDLEGAGDYLPVTEELPKHKNDGDKEKVLDEPTIRKNKVKATKANINASIEDPKGDGVAIDFLDESETGETKEIIPSGQNDGKGNDIHVGDDEASGNPDAEGHISIKHADLRGMTYRFYCINKENGRYGVSFVSDFTENEANFELYSIDEAGSKEPVMISSCLVNGEAVEIENEKTVEISLVKGFQYRLELTTDQHELFSGEVKMYAYR